MKLYKYLNVAFCHLWVFYNLKLWFGDAGDIIFQSTSDYVTNPLFGVWCPLVQLDPSKSTREFLSAIWLIDRRLDPAMWMMNEEESRSKGRPGGQRTGQQNRVREVNVRSHGCVKEVVVRSNNWVIEVEGGPRQKKSGSRNPISQIVWKDVAWDHPGWILHINLLMDGIKCPTSEIPL